MLSQNYYYIIAGLPDLTLDQGKLQFGTPELRVELKEGLSERDWTLFQHLLLVYDNVNLLAVMNKAEKTEAVEEGVYLWDTLESALEQPELLRPYMTKFIRSQQSETPLHPNLSPENELTTFYYEEMLALKYGFLRKWFTFELNLKNALLVITAKNNDIPYDKQIIQANKAAVKIARSNARDLGLTSEWPWIEKLLQISEMPDLLARERAIDLMRWEFLDEYNIFKYFSLEVLLAYYIKLSIIERWLKLDKATGEEMFRQLLDDLQNSYEFSKEFSIKDGRK
ncbi:MAG: DUF2764 family protein [Lentimicrobium sp.]|jgi:hypothetical protein|nr:DUF2764 family protein [Lentimicrobium sp.]